MNNGYGCLVITSSDPTALHLLRLHLAGGILPAAGAEQCTKISPGLQLTCVQSLAAGWITPADLCRRCTRRFMAALESAAGEGEPLAWHDTYVHRSGGAA